MRIKVKLVVFKHPEPDVWCPYCSYCPELKYFLGRGNSINEVVEDVEEHLHQELCHRFRYANLKLRGWEISEDSIKVPTFTDEEAISLTEKSYGIKIVEPQIIVIDVEVPEPQNLF